MHTRTRRATTAGLTMVEFVVVVFVIAAMVGDLTPIPAPHFR
jgi:hypothetical protein